ncbi:MAG: hypothetical protein ACXACU_19440, partial [Candidatus Hodarchaeales archaeon]
LKRQKAYCFYFLGFISNMKGELELAIDYNEQARKIYDKIKNPGGIAGVNLNAGFTSRLKGNLDQALNYYKKTLLMYDEYGMFLNQKGYIYFSIIRTYADIGSLKEAKKYLTDLKPLVEKTNNKLQKRWYQLSEALVLKISSNLRDRFKAENILKKIVESKIHTRNFIYIATSHLCDLLLMELRRTNDLNILNELNPLIINFSNNAKYQESYWHLADSKILQAKLALIQMNLGEARKLLTDAQEIADEHDLGILAQKISNEHDNLLNQLSQWEKFKEDDVPVSKRIELSSFDDVIDRLLEKRSVEEQKVVDEEPVLLLVIAEGGVLLFSFPFKADWERDNELFGSFLSAISSFSQEFLAEGLDRVKFGQYTIIMEPLATFSAYYVFKGQTYPAKQKLTHFTSLILEEHSIILTLDKFFQSNQIIELDDFPFLKTFIKGTFVSKR